MLSIRWTRFESSDLTSLLENGNEIDLKVG